MAQPIRRTFSIAEAESPRPVAVIDIGATSIRMEVAEISSDQNIRSLGTLVQSVALGREAFANRRLSRKSIEKAVDVLQQYKINLREYGITNTSDVRVVATSAVREASNRLAFVDRIFAATGFEVETIEEAEVNRITYMGIMPQLAANPELANGKSIVIESGGGSTEALVIRAGNVLSSLSFRLGALRLQQIIHDTRTSDRRHDLMESHIRRTIRQLEEEVSDRSINLVAVGGDIRFAANHFIKDWQPDTLAQLATKDLERLTKEILTLDENEIVQNFDVNHTQAETLGPSLLIYTMLAQHFEVSDLFVSDTNLRDGLLTEMASGGNWTAEFRNQIVRSAMQLGRKFDFDEMHARNVAELSRHLFDQLAEYHQLDGRSEVILYVAALLHEIGLMINSRSNHKHALYVIRNSNLFGLSQLELLLVGLVARYHRRASPQSSHDGYVTLDRENRVVVSKLAAILRIAIALDDTRAGRIREIECITEGNRMVIQIAGLDDVSLEQIAMRSGGGLFRDVFGMPVLLRSKK